MPSEPAITIDPPFDADAHCYLRPDGRPYGGSVTGRLKEFGLYKAEAFYTDYGRTRGRLIHLVTELDDLDDLADDSVDPALSGYLAAWRRFKVETHFEVAVVNGRLCVERRYGDNETDTAGTADRLGYVQLRGMRRFAVVDLKRGAAPAVYGVQLAAYADFVRRSGEFPDEPLIERVGVHLAENGTYQLHPYTDRNDLKVWRAVTTVSAWKRANGIELGRAA
ncbi:MAG: hypothetical protein IT356_03480 [Gemmatimonadaceae bacterium]|nr:hypothetical protein [Gemmatimonadaceae bacterium]